jgi:hypothetical protein
MSVTAPDPQQLRQQLDALAGRSDRFLSRWRFDRDLRVTSRDALLGLVPAPAAWFVVQLALLPAGRRVSWPLWLWVALTLAGPLVYLALRLQWLAGHRRADRRASLGVFDTQLETEDRLVTADEFLAARIEPGTPMDRFRLAAIEDAAPYVAKALDMAIAPRALPAWRISAQARGAVATAVVLMLAAVWLGRISSPVAAAAAPASVLPADGPETAAARLASMFRNILRPRPRADRKPSDEPADASPSRASVDASPRSTRTDQDADGQSHAGGQANSRSSSRAMSSSGTPSNQQTPSQAVEDEPPQDQKVDPAAPPKKNDGRKAEQQATSATSGQGQSKSSTSDMNKIPATDQPDRAGANKDDGKDEAGIQDEVEEEKAAGAEHPSLRKNKPAVDRNLSPRPTGDQPNPNANGRSGPGGLKKTRGVPAMILGVPTPDRIQGVNHPGRSKVTQENSTPKEEPQAAADAEARLAREQAFGHVDHPLLLPWMQHLIETYFVQLRSAK